LDDKNEARADGGRQFQREEPATEKDLDSGIETNCWSIKC